MPKVGPQQPVPWSGRLLITAFASWLLYMLWRHPVVIGGCIGAFFLFTWMHHRSVRNHLRTLMADRSGESICTFARAVNCRNLDTWIVRAVYEEIQRDLSSTCGKFPLRWEDRLQQDLRIDPDALDEELAMDIAERTGRDLSHADQNPLFAKVQTVGDLILFFHGQPMGS